MRSKNLYYDYWASYLDNFIEVIQQGGCQDESIEADDLIACGNRGKYSFLLEMEDGKVANNILGSSVARDLEKVLSDDARFRLLAKGKKIVFRLRRNFKLDIEVSSLPVQ